MSILSVATLSAQTVTLSGRVTNPEDEALAGILVRANNGPDMYETTTDGAGNWQLTVPSEASYIVRPCAYSDVINGLSTFDLVLLARHYDGVQPLASPYLIIAGDVNNDYELSEADSLAMREVILGMTTTFPDSLAWRFVPSDYVFPNPLDPFTPAYPQHINTGVISSNQTGLDFYGMRMGDLNFSAFYDSGFITQICNNLPSSVSGFVRKDDNADCIADANEPALGDWIVEVSGSGGTYQRNVGLNGQYRIPVAPGNYEVTLYKPNNLWGGCSTVHTNVQVDEFEEVTRDFSSQVIYECPSMEVDISSALLRRCFTSYYQLQYCNKGTETASDVTVEVQFDSLIEFQNAPVPFTNLGNNTYVFEIGDVEPGQCDVISLAVKVSCDAELGETHCTTAHIYPDSLCAPPPANWDGAELILSAKCLGDEVKFTVENIGDDMMEPVGYVVIEDIMIQMINDNSVQLNNGEQHSMNFPANGSTWRMELEQSPNHPYQNNVMVSLEGCGTDGNGVFSTGFVEVFPENDELPYFDTDCRANVGAYDPNDKNGYPLGVTASRYIPLGQPIDYLIRFQNTGTDTAFNIVILDTLSEHFNPTSIRTLNSSHPYTFNLLDNGVLQFAFNNIMLPDSNINEPESHGFVKFRIFPDEDLLNGTVVQNRAGIYFDFNEPIMTNYTLHTYGEQFLNIGNLYSLPGVALSIFPNPASAETTISVTDFDPTGGLIQVFNSLGQLVLEKSFNSNVETLDLQSLHSGPYWIKLMKDNQLFGSGIIQKVE